jgi:ribonucleoside-diphosphate reductase alpha chain
MAEDHRRKLPSERNSVTRRFVVGGMKGYVTVGLFEDGTPGEVFVKMSKTGATLSGLLDSWSIMVSIALQHGAPLATICDKMAYTRFDPSGFTGDEEIPYASSVMDWIARWMAKRFLGTEPVRTMPIMVTVPPPPRTAPGGPTPPAGALSPPVPAPIPPQQFLPQPPTPGSPNEVQMPLQPSPPQDIGNGPPCPVCGHLMVRTGKCWGCRVCAFSEGCG